MKKYLIFVLFTAVLLSASFTRNALWRNDMTIWANVLEKSPQKARGLNEIGIYYVETGQYEKALVALTRSLELDKFQLRSYLNMGLAYEGLKRYDLAVQMYGKAISYEPADPTTYYNLGVLYYKELKKRDLAYEMFRIARDLNPDEPDVHLFLSNIYRDRGDVQESQAEYQRYLMLK